MIHIYYLLSALALIFFGPFLLLRRKARAGLGEKLGLISLEKKQRLNRKNSLGITNQECTGSDTGSNTRAVASLSIAQRSRGSKAIAPTIWIHAVSVGELNAVIPLARQLAETYPGLGLAISTTTATGQALAQEKLSKLATIFYFPFDLPWITARWLDAIRPDLVAISETELWPGFAHQCHQRGIDLVSVNGRISPRSGDAYSKLGFFFAPVLRCYRALIVQSKSEELRYRAISGSEPIIHVTGNLKLDGMHVPTIESREQLARELNLSLNGEDFVLIAGSTHEGEESAMIEIFKALRERTKSNSFECKPRLIIAPRHPERFDRVFEIVENAGFNPVKYSNSASIIDDNDIYILDGLGQLARYYSIASAAFVGGTIARVGGHSLAEPAACAIPVVSGPHIFKTRDIARALSEAGALKICPDVQEMKEIFIELMSDSSMRDKMGQAGLAWVKENQGAVEKTIDIITNILDNRASCKNNAQNSRISEANIKTPEENR